MGGYSYKFTFEDGSEAFAHYGVKGMKWRDHIKSQAYQMGDAVNNYLVNPLMSLLNPGQQEEQKEEQKEEEKKPEEKKPEEKKPDTKKKFKKLSDKQREKIATAVVRGDYGNGKDRVRALKKAGYNPKTIQRRVNEMVWGLPKDSLKKTSRTQ